MSETSSIGILASGGGRSLANLAAEIQAGRLAAQLAGVWTDRENSGVLERAQHLEIPARVLPWRSFAGPAEFSQAVFEELGQRGVQLVVLAGFLRLLVIPPAWLGRVLNIHPSLLPAFGGKGYYGERVHRAVLEQGAATTGCTVHFVDNEYDHGPVILQRQVAVQPGDTVSELAARVFEEEKKALPEAVRRVLAGQAHFR